MNLNFLPLIVNLLVITALVAEIAGIALGIISPTQLLIGSFISGLLTLLSFRLSKIALKRLHAQDEPAAATQQASHRR